MKKFILKTFLFLAPVLIVAIFMEIALRSIPNSYSAKKAYLDDNSNEVEVLVLGNSHASMGIIPNYITGNCFNAAMTSQSIDIDYEILKKYEGNWSKLETVIIPIDYLTLFSQLKSGIEYWRIKDYVLYYKLPIQSDINTHFEVFSRQLHLNLKRLINYYIKHNSELIYTEVGNEDFRLKKKDYELVSSGIIAAKRHTANTFSLLDQNINILKNIVDFCLIYNHNILLYTSPAFSSYSSQLDSFQIGESINISSTFAANYINCSYKNFLYDSAFTRKDFYDGDHLNEVGAIKLSTMINGIIYDH